MKYADRLPSKIKSFLKIYIDFCWSFKIDEFVVAVSLSSIFIFAEYALLCSCTPLIFHYTDQLFDSMYRPGEQYVHDIIHCKYLNLNTLEAY